MCYQWKLFQMSSGKLISYDQFYNLIPDDVRGSLNDSLDQNIKKLANAIMGRKPDIKTNSNAANRNVRGDSKRKISKSSQEFAPTTKIDSVAPAVQQPLAQDPNPLSRTNAPAASTSWKPAPTTTTAIQANGVQPVGAAPVDQVPVFNPVPPPGPIYQPVPVQAAPIAQAPVVQVPVFNPVIPQRPIYQPVPVQAAPMAQAAAAAAAAPVVQPVIHVPVPVPVPVVQAAPMAQAAAAATAASDYSGEYVSELPRMAFSVNEFDRGVMSRNEGGVRVMDLNSSHRVPGMPARIEIANSADKLSDAWAAARSVGAGRMRGVPALVFVPQPGPNLTGDSELLGGVRNALRNAGRMRTNTAAENAARGFLFWRNANGSLDYVAPG